MNEYLERFFAVQNIPEEERKKYRAQLEKEGSLTIGSSSFVMTEATTVAPTVPDPVPPKNKK